MNQTSLPLHPPTTCPLRESHHTYRDHNFLQELVPTTSQTLSVSSTSWWLEPPKQDSIPGFFFFQTHLCSFHLLHLWSCKSHLGSDPRRRLYLLLFNTLLPPVCFSSHLTAINLCINLFINLCIILCLFICLFVCTLSIEYKALREQNTWLVPLYCQQNVWHRPGRHLGIVH